MTSLQYFRIFAPEYASTPDATVQVWLGIAATQIATGCLTAELAAQAEALYAAHLLTLSVRASQGSANTSGPIKREKEGDLEREYASSSGADTYLGQTIYGQQYMDITLACYGSAIMTRNG